MTSVSFAGPGDEPIVLDVTTPAAQVRVPTTRRYLMCPPAYFTVEYAINPWMDPTQPISTSLAVEQWTALKETYERLGHQVEARQWLARLAAYQPREGAGFSWDDVEIRILRDEAESVILGTRAPAPLSAPSR